MTTASATISPCETYRYDLQRSWIGGEGYVLFVGLNPSTADATQDDPTIRRCIGYAKAWGFAGLRMGNLFAWRGTDPNAMVQASKAGIDVIGPDNDRHLRQAAAGAALVVAAWGARGTLHGRDRAVRDMLPGMHVLKLTRDGHPGHPLYLPKALKPAPWPVAVEA